MKKEETLSHPPLFPPTIPAFAGIQPPFPPAHGEPVEPLSLRAIPEGKTWQSHSLNPSLL